MIDMKALMSSIGVMSMSGFLIVMFYLIRSNSSIPKGPYTWISNFCIFLLFLIFIFVLFVGLAYSTPTDSDDNSVPSLHMHYLEDKEDRNSLVSLFLSKYILLPIILVEVTIYVSLNSRLLWTWYFTGEWNTIVNKFLFLQRIWGIIYMVGCPVDFGLRLFGDMTFTLISMENYCTCWMIFYKALFYTIMTSQFAVAVNRFVCVAYPIQYHTK